MFLRYFSRDWDGRIPNSSISSCDNDGNYYRTYKDVVKEEVKDD